MSTLYCDSLENQVKFDMDSVILEYPYSSPKMTQYTCLGQDAFYILRKRALMLDLWNLLPETIQTEKEKNNFYDLPVIIDNSREIALTRIDAIIPLQ